MGQHGKSLPSFDAPETLKGRKIEWEYENLTHGNKAYNGYVTLRDPLIISPKRNHV